MVVNYRHIILAGVPRSGSTSLYTYLLQHPEICASRVKETQHFLPAASAQPIGSKEAYMEFFSHWQGEKFLMEASPSYYFGGSDVAGAINGMLDDVSIIFIFRDPAERLFSYFTHEKMFGNLEKDVVFEDFLHRVEKEEPSIIASGYYVNYMRGWHDFFADSIMPFYFDDLKEQPQKLMSQLCNWLEISADIYETYEFTRENRGAIYRNKKLHMAARVVNTRFEAFLRRNHRLKRFLRSIYYLFNEAKEEKPILQPETYNYLAEIYRPYNIQFYQFLAEHGYPIGGWLSKYALKVA